MKSIEYLKVAGIILMAVSLPFSETLKTAGLIIAAVMLIVQIVRKETILSMNVMSYGFMLLIVSALISTAFANQTAKSLKGVEDIIIYVSAFFVACSIYKKDNIRKILWAIYLSTSLAVVFGIYHAVSINKQLEIHALGNWNYTGMFLNIVAASMLSTLLFSDMETKAVKFILGIMTIVTVVASVMTLSRASMVGLMVFIAFIVLVGRRSKKVLLLSGGLLVAAAFFYKTMWFKLLSIKSLISRSDIWNHAIRVFLDNPVAGIGLNNFSYTFPITHPVEPGNTVYDAHSIYLQTASQMGAIGLLALILIILGFIHIWMNFRPGCGFGRALKFSALGAFLITTVTGFFDTTLHHEHAIVFTMMAGLMLGYRSGIDNKSSREQKL